MFAAHLLVVAGLGCHDSTSGSMHHGEVDAGPDATIASCNSFSIIPDCPADRRYCCGGGDSWSCSSEFSTGSSFVCREEPVGGLLTSCDATTGAQCPADHPICCFETNVDGYETYCTDHAYLGFNWECSP